MKGQSNAKGRGSPIPQLTEKRTVLAPFLENGVASLRIWGDAVEGTSCTRGQHACMKCGKVGEPITKH
eukprot:2729416-Amphidinium_carterae.1